jgi:hypothetical protein
MMCATASFPTGLCAHVAALEAEVARSNTRDVVMVESVLN